SACPAECRDETKTLAPSRPGDATRDPGPGARPRADGPDAPPHPRSSPARTRYARQTEPDNVPPPRAPPGPDPLRSHGHPCPIPGSLRYDRRLLTYRRNTDHRAMDADRPGPRRPGQGRDGPTPPPPLPEDLGRESLELLDSGSQRSLEEIRIPQLDLVHRTHQENRTRELRRLLEPRRDQDPALRIRNHLHRIRQNRQDVHASIR